MFSAETTFSVSLLLTELSSEVVFLGSSYMSSEHINSINKTWTPFKTDPITIVTGIDYLLMYALRHIILNNIIYMKPRLKCVYS